MLHLLTAILVLIAFTWPQTLPYVVVQTDPGEIEMGIDTVRAPATAASFLKYVDAGFYDGGLFHRTVRPDNQREKAVKIAERAALIES